MVPLALRRAVIDCRALRLPFRPEGYPHPWTRFSRKRPARSSWRCCSGCPKTGASASSAGCAAARRRSRLARADVAVVSFGKSGRTWLRVMISRYYQLLLLGSRKACCSASRTTTAAIRDIPKIFFTHDNYIKDYTGDFDDEALPSTARRSCCSSAIPKDIAVSQYFQWQHRMRPAEEEAESSTRPTAPTISAYDFVMDENVGLPGIIDYLNLWSRESDQRREPAHHPLRGHAQRIPRRCSRAGDGAS